MYQDAVNVLSGLMDAFEEPLSIKVIASNLIVLDYDGGEEKIFNNAIDLVEWMEGNLTKK